MPHSLRSTPGSELQRKVEAKRLVEIGHERGRKNSDSVSEALYRDRPNLLCLRLRALVSSVSNDGSRTWKGYMRVVAVVTGTTVTTPRPSRVAAVFAPSFETITAGRSVSASEPRS